MSTFEPVPLLTTDRRTVLRRRVRLVVGATITYNIVEAIVALTAGTISSSGALFGFGLDSTVEVISALAVLWQFSGHDHEAREKVALRVIAFSFFALAAYVGAQAVAALIARTSPEHSTVGIVLAATSLLVMPALSWFERRTGHELGSASVVSDSKQTLVCSYLSAVLLIGLVANTVLGWWWADPVAALVIAGFAVREGAEAWRGDACGASAGALLSDPEAEVGCADGCEGDCCR